MAVFNFEFGENVVPPRDWKLLQNGASTLYLNLEFLEEDIEWLKAHNYQIDIFDSSLWQTEAEMHKDFAAKLDFPGWYGENLDAFKDCLGYLEVSEESGRALVFNNYNVFADKFPHAAWATLNSIERVSRSNLLFGRRLIGLVYSNDGDISLPPLGANGLRLNHKCWLKSWLEINYLVHHK